MGIEYGCYVKQKTGGPNCYGCDKPVEFGQAYARIYCNSYANPYFHADCLDKIADKALAEKDNRQIYIDKKEEEEAIQAKYREEQKQLSAENRDKNNFKKQVIKDAMKEMNIAVSKLSLTLPLWDDKTFAISEVGWAHGKSGKKQFAWVKIEEDKVKVFQPTNYYYRKGWEIFSDTLADPNAFKKLGAAIYNASPSYMWEPYMKKSRKKKKNGSTKAVQTQATS